jgi:hypothetical protein
MTSAEQNKALVRRLVAKGVNDRNLDVLDEVGTGAIADAARRWIGPFRESFPGLLDGDRRPDCRG